jgi:hypothetical protein
LLELAIGAFPPSLKGSDPLEGLAFQKKPDLLRDGLREAGVLFKGQAAPKRLSLK